MLCCGTDCCKGVLFRSEEGRGEGVSWRCGLPYVMALMWLGAELAGAECSCSTT
jgi:hypothetical protein